MVLGGRPALHARDRCGSENVRPAAGYADVLPGTEIRKSHRCACSPSHSCIPRRFRIAVSLFRGTHPYTGVSRYAFLLRPKHQLKVAVRRRITSVQTQPIVEIAGGTPGIFRGPMPSDELLSPVHAQVVVHVAFVQVLLLRRIPSLVRSLTVKELVERVQRLAGIISMVLEGATSRERNRVVARRSIFESRQVVEELPPRQQLVEEFPPRCRVHIRPVDGPTTSPGARRPPKCR